MCEPQNRLVFFCRGALEKAEMLSEEEVKGTLEEVASSGKFW